jgi:hypothetical protein
MTEPFGRDPPHKLHGRGQIDLFPDVYKIPLLLLAALLKSLDFWTLEVTKSEPGADRADSVDMAALRHLAASV